MVKKRVSDSCTSVSALCTSLFNVGTFRGFLYFLPLTFIAVKMCSCYRPLYNISPIYLIVDILAQLSLLI